MSSKNVPEDLWRQLSGMPLSLFADGKELARCVTKAEGFGDGVTAYLLYNGSAS